MSEQKLCRYCNKEIPIEATYCLHCGKKVNIDNEKRFPFSIINENIIISIVAVLIIVIITFILIVTNTSKTNNKSNTTVSNNTTYSTTNTQLSEFEAQSKAEKEFLSSEYRLKNNSGVSTVGNISIESNELVNEYGNAYYFELKGNYFGYDEYGMVVGRYTFDAKIKVTYDGFSMIDTCTTRKAY